MAWRTRKDEARRALWTCVLGTCAATAYAQATPDGPSAQAAQAAPPEIAEAAAEQLTAALDPLDQARAVARLGDIRVLARLAVARGEHGAATNVASVLAAVRSAQWLADASRAFPALMELMPSRDPDLAPAAARAVVAIARGLVEGDRVPEAVDAAQLDAWKAQLAAIEKNARVRPDIRLAATQSIALLNATRELL